MIVGGMSQFLTDIQRMPKSVIARLNKLTRKFLWEDKTSPPVSFEQLLMPIEQGGLGLLDLASRNEAIDLMWLKAYLDFSEERPWWAFIADDILAENVATVCTPQDAELRINPFLQHWKPIKTGLPPELRAIIEAARTNGLRLEGRAFSREIIRAMPMWDHSEADKTKIRRLGSRSAATACLKDTHGARTVGDFERIAVEMGDPSHEQSRQCECDRCTYLKLETGCRSPQECFERARAFLDTLPQKWDPRGEHPCDYEDEGMKNVENIFETEEYSPVIFDRRVTTTGSLGNAFRIFTGPQDTCNTLPDVTIMENDMVQEVATDGACERNGERNASAGAGVFFALGDNRNRAFRIPKNIEQSNQTGEAVAALQAGKMADPTRPLLQITDSRTTMDAVTKRRIKYEDEGYFTQKNGELTRAIVSEVFRRRAHTAFCWVKGHNGHPGNEAADALAGAGAKKNQEDQISLEEDPTTRLTGAKLTKLTQKLAYKVIRARKAAKMKARPRTAERVERIMKDLDEDFEIQVTEAHLWTSLRKTYVSKEARQWMWLTIHDGYMVGSHWLRPKMSDELRERASCKACGQLESMEHILFTCNACGREVIWKLLSELWESTGLRPPIPSWGSVLGAACVAMRSPNGARQPALEQRWATLAIESARLIWKLRCERVIAKNGDEFPAVEVTNRWYAELERRLHLDRRIAALSHGKKRKKYIRRLEEVWSPLLAERGNLPPNWVTKSEVLVGIKRGNG